ncbi:hypothetical protein OG301_21320 [Streptomyces platensis]|uniref:hypothetical protein n=1 Tax=Streptomyces platensis TaxID=58346 RepID=UPI002ED1FEC8|nr:hypothetical protein OG301_21320 [Streptomyces platensis]
MSRTDGTAAPESSKKFLYVWLAAIAVVTAAAVIASLVAGLTQLALAVLAMGTALAAAAGGPAINVRISIRR